MLNEVAALVAIVSVIAAPRAGVAAEPSTQERAWLTHTDPEARLEVSYPADWERPLLAVSPEAFEIASF